MMLSILLGLAPSPLPIALPLAFQRAQAESAQQTDEVRQTAPIIEYFHPKRADTKTLIRMMQEIAASGGMDRKMYMDDNSYTRVRPLFLPYGDAVLVKDTPEGMPKTVAMLTDLDANFVDHASSAFQDKTQAFQYTLTHVGVDAVQNALFGLYNSAPQAARGGSSRPQLSFVREQSLVLVRGDVEQIAEVERILKRLDVPRPRVTLSFFLIQGTTAEDNDVRVPADLAADLSTLVPYEGFKLLSSAILPSDTSGKIMLRAELENGGGRLDLQMRPEAYDGSTGTLTLGSVEVDLITINGPRKETNSFVTSTSLKAGEYTVLGAVGANPVFMVIKLSKAR